MRVWQALAKLGSFVPWHTEPTETISVFKWNALIYIYVDFSSYFEADGPKDILIAKTAAQTKEKVDNVTNRYIKI